MKKILALLTTGALLAPAVAFAAYNDVSVTSSATLSVNSIEINISGTEAVLESIVVGADSFTANFAPGSVLTVNAPGRNIMTVSPSAGVGYDITCTDSSSSILVSPRTDSASAITITPSASLCTTAVSSSNSSGSTGNGPVAGGGGGGSAPVAVVPTTPSSNAAAAASAGTPASGLSTIQINAILALLASFSADQATIDNVRLALSGQATSGSAPSAGATFTRNLEVGMTGEDVKALQVWLNANGYTVAATGPGSTGSETTRFGSATKAALIKFQQAKGITPAAGYFGPKTRAALGQ